MEKSESSAYAYIQFSFTNTALEQHWALVVLLLSSRLVFHLIVSVLFVLPQTYGIILHGI